MKTEPITRRSLLKRLAALPLVGGLVAKALAESPPVEAVPAAYMFADGYVASWRLPAGDWHTVMIVSGGQTVTRYIDDKQDGEPEPASGGPLTMVW